MIQAENCPEWVALFWACVARGIHVVPIDFNFTPELASRIRADCGAKLGADAVVLENLRIRACRGPAQDFSITPSVPDDIVEIIYTSGTTGEPHGIVHRHRNICANLDPFRREISKYRRWAAPFQPIRILELLPLSHMFGQSMGLFVPLMLEGSVAFTSEIRPSAIINLVHDNRISVIVSGAPQPRVFTTRSAAAHPESWCGVGFTFSRPAWCRCAMVEISKGAFAIWVEVLGVRRRRRSSRSGSGRILGTPGIRRHSRLRADRGKSCRRCQSSIFFETRVAGETRTRPGSPHRGRRRDPGPRRKHCWSR